MLSHGLKLSHSHRCIVCELSHSHTTHPISYIFTRAQHIRYRIFSLGHNTSDLVYFHSHTTHTVSHISTRTTAHQISYTITVQSRYDAMVKLLLHTICENESYDLANSASNCSQRPAAMSNNLLLHRCSQSTFSILYAHKHCYLHFFV